MSRLTSNKELVELIALGALLRWHKEKLTAGIPMAPVSEVSLEWAGDTLTAYYISTYKSGIRINLPLDLDSFLEVGTDVYTDRPTWAGNVLSSNLDMAPEDRYPEC